MSDSNSETTLRLRALLAAMPPVEASQDLLHGAHRRVRRRRGVVVAATAAAVVMMITTVGALAGSKGSHQTEPGSSQPPTHDASSGSLSVSVSPTSGPVGTVVQISATGCADPDGRNHAVSFNNDSLNSNARNDPNTVRTLASDLADGHISAHYVVIESDRTGGVGAFFVQCGQTVRQANFRVEEPGAPPAGLPGLPCGDNKNGQQTRYLPVSLAIACGDNGVRAIGLTWQGWTASRALARGVFMQNDCKPTCLGGHLIQYPGARFEFSGPLYNNNFSTVVVTFSQGRTGPNGERRIVIRL